MRCNEAIDKAITEGKAFGKSTIGKGKRVHMEYVSANPTGPLHVGHGRGAAYGSCVANLLLAAGFNVHREYYVNDAGRQICASSLSAPGCATERYQAHIDMPKAGYQGDYIIEIAEAVDKRFGAGLAHHKETILEKIPSDLDPVEG